MCGGEKEALDWNILEEGYSVKVQAHARRSHQEVSEGVNLPGISYYGVTAHWS